ncbi:MAG: type II secretion system F family protein [Candidatus Methylomirabilis oxyfera]|nr:type II secretion system F family protein [Candidatus Methylomirabilis oxyfera]
MPIFAYRGRARGGRLITGQVEANTPHAVAAQLRERRIMATSVKQTPEPLRLKIPGFGGKVKDKELTVFTRQIATMINAGLPLVQSLEVLASQQSNKQLKKVLTKIREDVEEGATFADSLKRYPAIFSPLFASMIEAGEAGGFLDTVLNRLAGYIEKSMTLRRKVKGALIYPAVIITVAVTVVIFLLIFVIPTFKALFEGFGAALPLPTRIVLETSRLVRAHLLAGLGMLVGAAVGLRLYYRTEKGKGTIDFLLLRLPVLGELIRKVSVAKFTRTLGTLVSSGVPILQGLNITARVAGNKIVEEAILKTRSSIAEGKTIADPLRASGVFPPMVVQMISVGERTGALDAMLSKIADFYDAEVDQAVANLTTLLEPFMIVFLGVVVGGVIIAMYLPIFKLVTVVGR